jgi:hypothetical protein
MINHISIGANNPEKVANVLADLWNGYAYPFPPSPGSFVVFEDDNRGTLVEITPINTVLVPGEGLPNEENFSINTPTGEHEAKFVSSDFSPKFVATHLNINTNLSYAEIKAIADREGWRCFTANRENGLFQLIELWIEDRFLLEVNTPEMTEMYVAMAQPENWANLLQMPFQPKVSVPHNLGLIG